MEWASDEDILVDTFSHDETLLHMVVKYPLLADTIPIFDIVVPRQYPDKVVFKSYYSLGATGEQWIDLLPLKSMGDFLWDARMIMYRMGVGCDVVLPNSSDQPIVYTFGEARFEDGLTKDSFYHTLNKIFMAVLFIKGMYEKEFNVPVDSFENMPQDGEFKLKEK